MSVVTEKDIWSAMRYWPCGGHHCRLAAIMLRPIGNLQGTSSNGDDVAKPAPEICKPQPIPRPAAARFAGTTTPSLMRSGQQSFRLKFSLLMLRFDMRRVWGKDLGDGCRELLELGQLRANLNDKNF
jgi:hypothetical protein